MCLFVLLLIGFVLEKLFSMKSFALSFDCVVLALVEIELMSEFFFQSVHIFF